MSIDKRLTDGGNEQASVQNMQNNNDSFLTSLSSGQLVVRQQKMPFSAFSRKVLYVYSIDDANHIGMVKVGDTTIKLDKLNDKSQDFERLAKEAAHKRIKQDIAGAHGVEIKYNLEFATIVWNDPYGNFRDYTIHDLLEYNGFERVKFSYTKAREWFKASVKDIIDALNAYNNGFKSIDANKVKRYIELREEQVATRNNTLEARHLGEKERLWDCKPRFGKTTTGIAVLLESHANPKYQPIHSVLIATNRPDVLDSWFKEYETMMGETEWQFSSKKHGVAFDKIDKSKSYIVFMSLQDLKGKDKDSVTSFKKSNQAIYSHDWDFLFIDEAHEGNDTQLADEVHEGLKRGFTLYLSGTPFKYLASGKFKPEQIDTWDYIQEQTAKQNWDYSKGDNPYKLQPQLWINAIDLSPETKELFSKGVDASAFDFSEFFKLDSNDKFINEKYIKSLLKRMQGDGEPKVDDIEPVLDTPSEPHMPYSESFRETTKHTLWVLPPNVKACRALGKLLEEDSFFKDYTVIVAAGSDTAESKNALKSVQNAIKNSDKTITLTVGKLTTGVTVPEWTGVMMLTNMSSAALYTQTIFRTQSPYEFDGKIKENVYTWDFAPDRVLSVMSEVAGISSKAGVINGESQRARLGEMLNFMPIIAYTSAGDFRQLSAGEISLKLKAFYAERAINSGFETPVLFRKDLENVPENIRKAIQELYLASGSSTRAKEPKWEVIISSTGDAPEYEYLEPTEPREPKELTAEQEELRKKRLELLKERENMRNILYAASSRIPFILLAKMCDKEFRKNLNLGNEFGFKELAESFDDESWKEFFQTISKDLFISLEEAFDMDTTRGAILQWINNVQEALDYMGKDSKQYAEHVYRFMKKIKNPNKETVFTPAEVVKLVYEAAGFKDLSAWKPLYLNGEEAAKAQVDPFPTFYDINVKSGLFPMEAANNLFQVSSGRSWKQVCNESIYANARTVAGKWATCSLLGMNSDWKNITVIDVYKELQADDLQHLTDEGKQLFVSHFLLSPLNNNGNPNAVLSDITNKEERVAIIKIVEAYEKENKDLNKKFEREEMTEESYKKSKKDLESRVKKELNTSKQFDYTISNPPYQIVTNEKNGAATAIWQHFLVLASQISKHIAMINPARWQKGGQGTGLIPTKTWLMGNKHFHKVINMPAGEIFPTASIAGDVSIEVIDNTKAFANPKIGTWDKSNGWSELKDFILSDEIDIPLSSKDLSLITSIKLRFNNYCEKSLWLGGQLHLTNKIAKITRTVVSRKDYGIESSRMYREEDYFIKEPLKKPNVNYVKIFYKEKGTNNLSERYLPLSEFQNNNHNNLNIPLWKSLVPKAGADFMYRNLGPIAAPNEIATDSWLCRSFESKIEAFGYNSYIKTYFYRYLLSVRNVTHNAYANVHRFVPDLKDVKNPRTGKIGYESDWTDDDLVILFKDILTVEDWKHIKATALAADKGKGDYESGWTFPDGTKLHSLTLPSEGVEVMPVLSKPYAIKYLEDKAKDATKTTAASTEPSEDA